MYTIFEALETFGCRNFWLIKEQNRFKKLILIEYNPAKLKELDGNYETVE